MCLLWKWVSPSLWMSVRSFRSVVCVAVAATATYCSVNWVVKYEKITRYLWWLIPQLNNKQTGKCDAQHEVEMVVTIWDPAGVDGICKVDETQQSTQWNRQWDAHSSRLMNIWDHPRRTDTAAGPLAGTFTSDTASIRRYITPSDLVRFGVHHQSLTADPIP